MRRYHLSLGAVVLNAISVAHAQQQNGTEGSQTLTASVPRIEVVGSANSYDPRRDDTAAKIVVSNDELVKYGDTSVAEALKRIPGVMVTSTGRGSDIRMRGLGGGYTQILVNGERAPFGFSVDSLPPEQVERLEVIRSAIAEFSTESIAGTINIVLKKVAKRPERQLQVGYGGDATDRTARAVLTLSDRLNGFSYSVGVYARSSQLNRNRLIEETGEDASGRSNLVRTTNSHDTGPFNIVSIVPRLNWTLANGDTLSSESDFTYTKYGFNSEQLTASTLGDPPLYPALDWRIGVRNAFLKSGLVWDTRLSPDSRLEVKLSVQAASGDNDSSRESRGAGASLLKNRMEVAMFDRGLDSSGKFSHKMGETHQLKAGWEASRTKRDEENDELNLVAAGIAPTSTVTPLNASIVRLASFLQDEWTVMPNWMAYVGIRWERIATDISADRRIKTASSIFSPIAQTLIKLPNMPNDQVRLAFTRTFRAPDIAGLSPLQRKFETNSSTNPDRAGNPGLRPEQARGVDLTYEHNFTKSALFSIGGSNREIDDYTLTEVTLGSDGRWVARPINAGRARTNGLELEARFPLTLLDAMLPAVEVRSSLSRNWSSVEQVPAPENLVAQQMPLSASLSLDYSYGPLTTGGNFIFRQGAWSRVSAAQRAGTWNNRNLDLYGVWKLNAKKQLRVTLGNLLASDTIAASEYTDTAGTIRRTTIVPGYASVRALFEQKF